MLVEAVGALHELYRLRITAVPELKHDRQFGQCEAAQAQLTLLAEL